MDREGTGYRVQGSTKDYEIRNSKFEIRNASHPIKGGFTLLEVLVALVILSITFVWLLKAENQAIDMGLRSKFVTTSTMLAGQKIAQIMSDPQSIDTAETDDFGEDYKKYTFEQHLDAIPAVSDYWKYTLTIRWGDKEKAGIFETEFVTFVSGK